MEVGRTSGLDSSQLAAFEHDGCVILHQFASATVTSATLEAAIALARREPVESATDRNRPFVLPEANLNNVEVTDPEERVSKVFRVHREEPFHSLATRSDLVATVSTLLGTDMLSCFLSQFIFKNPGAWGQPCHQDSFYFPFIPMRPVVGVWLACTDATLENGCLWVVPGSHRERIHEHIPDQRPNANVGYVEIVDYDLSSAVPVVMAAGDLLLFDSYLMHYSTDNQSSKRRAAMVYHYAPSSTQDHTVETRGYTINDWMEIPAAAEA
jgi:ectoine hydroxylase-related dioxygenase (phytanoyl-CoA dioxygenase family)